MVAEWNRKAQPTKQTTGRSWVYENAINLSKQTLLQNAMSTLILMHFKQHNIANQCHIKLVEF